MVVVVVVVVEWCWLLPGLVWSGPGLSFCHPSFLLSLSLNRQKLPIHSYYSLPHRSCLVRLFVWVCVCLSLLPILSLLHLLFRSCHLGSAVIILHRGVSFHIFNLIPPSFIHLSIAHHGVQSINQSNSYAARRLVVVPRHYLL